ncbi:response regulator transcription factor [Rhodomicrobium sp. Az07]|uniref:response regulator n=1 Tax=Rhodomicrobium sp. Az07 TaxID=2839034 RepID=UPI001BE83414|nr:response regulator transcription factor [Rhodomicrobium sp. Az07]MBT3071863.1 response regulator transcription factor [Rhodomicrobium sp. Az07]
MTEPCRLRVFIADDHPVVLAGVRSLLDRDPEVEIVGEALDGETTLRMAIGLKPAMILLDLSMPGLNGVEVARRLHAQLPDCKVVVLTVHEDRAYLRKLIEVGAAGYVLKRSVAEDLLRAIHAVASGGMYLDPAIAAQAVDWTLERPSEIAMAGADLSEREVEVLRLASVGHSNKAIANILSISVRSVETYKARAMDKLGFDNRVDLMGYAIGKGWLAAS